MEIVISERMEEKQPSTGLQKKYSSDTANQEV